MDPLEDVLSLVDASSYLSTGMTAGGTWAVRFAPPTGVKFNSVRRGRCLILVDGQHEPIPLEQGDAFLLTQPIGFVMASDLAVPPVPARSVFADATDGMAHAGTGDDVEVIGGGFTFNQRARKLLLANLPPILHVPATTPQADSVQWVLQRISAESRHQSLGAGIVAQHLAMVLLIEVLRLHLAREPHSITGWLAGTADPIVGDALRAMHDRPDRPWTVGDLAGVTKVSRSTLAARFKSLVGIGPLEYLTSWRIELASQRLSGSTETLDRIARRVGYGSESALSTAFKRVTGTTPREYRKQHAGFSERAHRTPFGAEVRPR